MVGGAGRYQPDYRHLAGVSGGVARPWLYGKRPTIADAMYAPVATRFRTYDVKVDRVSEAYCEHVLAWPDLREWWAAAQREPEQIEELDIEF